MVSYNQFYIVFMMALKVKASLKVHQITYLNIFLEESIEAILFTLIILVDSILYSYLNILLN